MYDYQAIDAAGNLVNGQIAARSQREAQRTLETRSLVPVTLTVSKPAVASRRWLQRGSSPRDDALLVEQLALLLCAGIPLMDAVASLKNQSLHPSYAESLAEVERRRERPVSEG